MKVKIGKYEKDGFSRKIKIRIDRDDLYDLSHTLGVIILSALKQFEHNKKGTPVDMYTQRHWDLNAIGDKNRTKKENTEYKKEEKQAVKKWSDIIKSMIWSFEQIAVNDIRGTCDEEFNNKLTYGLEMFAKYYFALWT